MKKTLAIITGASGGLGRAFARVAAIRNYDLLLIDLPETCPQDFAAELAKTYAIKVGSLALDITHPKAISAIEAYIRKESAKVGLLINNAAVASDQSFATLSLNKMQLLLQLNVIQTTALIYTVLPYMHELPGATILNVSSMAACFPMPFKGIYAASKAYLRMMSLSLHCELKSSGIQVAALCPFGILSNAVQRIRFEQSDFIARKTFMYPDAVAGYALSQALNGEALIIPGFLCRLLYRVCSLMPLAWQFQLAASRFKKPMPQPAPIVHLPDRPVLVA